MDFLFHLFVIFDLISLMTIVFTSVGFVQFFFFSYFSRRTESWLEGGKDLGGAERQGKTIEIYEKKFNYSTRDIAFT